MPMSAGATTGGSRAITLPSARVSCVTKPRHSARRQLRLPMLDGRYVNAAGDKMDGDLAVRKMHLPGRQRVQLRRQAVDSLPLHAAGRQRVPRRPALHLWARQATRCCTGATTPTSSTPLNQPTTIRCGNDAKLIFDNTDGERYTVLSFREAGAEYANIALANSEAFVFSGKPVTIGSSLTTYMNGVLDGMKMERNLFFKTFEHHGHILLRAQSDGSPRAYAPTPAYSVMRRQSAPYPTAGISA